MKTMKGRTANRLCVKTRRIKLLANVDSQAVCAGTRNTRARGCWWRSSGPHTLSILSWSFVRHLQICCQRGPAASPVVGVALPEARVFTLAPLVG